MEPQAECWVKWEINPSPVGATPVPLVPPAKAGSGSQIRHTQDSAALRPGLTAVPPTAHYAQKRRVRGLCGAGAFGLLTDSAPKHRDDSAPKCYNVCALTGRGGTHRGWQSPHPVRKGGEQEPCPNVAERVEHSRDPPTLWDRAGWTKLHGPAPRARKMIAHGLNRG